MASAGSADHAGRAVGDGHRPRHLLKPRNAGLITRRPDGSYFDPESVVIEWKR